MTQKINFLLLTIGILFTTITFGQKKVSAYLQNKQLYALESGPYVEVQTQFSAVSLKYNNTSEGLQAEVYYNLSVAKDNKVIKTIVFKLLSPFMKDSTIEDFYDIQHISLEPGLYEFSIELADLVANSESVKSKFKVNVVEPKENGFLSDLFIAEVATKTDKQNSFTKSNYEIIPRLSNFFTPNYSHIPVYLEIYNLEAKSNLEVCYSIIDDATKQVVPDTYQTKKVNIEKVSSFILPIEITKIGTGKYTLQVELREVNGDRLDIKNYIFDRQNDLEVNIETRNVLLDPAFQNSIPTDSLRFYVASIIPICPSTQQKFIYSELKDKNASEEQLRKIMQAFWIATSPKNTTEAWINYKEQVLFVERNFRNPHMPGYVTDRGRVYLQYGAPSRTFSKEMSPSEYPWEIWEYNKIGNFSNRKFLFYNPDLSSNRYTLLHSDMLGELRNPRWDYELNKRNTVNGSVDDPTEYKLNSYGDNAREIMNR